MGNVGVVLLNAPQHLLVQLLLKALGPLHCLQGKAVLRFQVRENVRIMPVAQPIIIVDPFVSKVLQNCGCFLCNGRNEF